MIAGDDGNKSSGFVCNQLEPSRYYSCSGAGLGLGAKLALDGSARNVHRAIGIAVSALILAQVSFWWNFSSA